MNRAFIQLQRKKIGIRVMLSISDLINRESLPQEQEISLKLLIDFYEKYLCARVFIFTLEDDTEVKIIFTDSSEVFHLLGANHIYANIPMTGKRFASGVRDESITLATLRKLNAKAYRDYLDRICSLACIDAVLKKSEYLWFKDGKIQDSSIEVKYLLLKNIDEKSLHLGIDRRHDDKPYFAKTLLVTEGNRRNKFIDAANACFKVKRLQIRDKESDILLEDIQRDSARLKADEQVRIYARKYFEQNKENFDLRILPEKEIKTELKHYIEENIEEIRATVAKQDPYWTKKIVSEAVRKYLRKDARASIQAFKQSLTRY